MAGKPTRAIEIFYSYAPADEEWRIKLDEQLSNLKRQNSITGWHYNNISPGTERENQISTYLNRAAIILLLISPDFIASDDCYSEMKRAMEHHETGEARIIPILLRPTDMKGTPFEKLQSLPMNGIPVKRWPDHDEAFLDIAKGIRQVVEELNLTESGMASLRQQYCTAIYEQWKTLDFRGIMHAELHRPMGIPLTEVFVFPDVLVGIPEYETLEREDHPKSDGSKEKRTTRQWEGEQEEKAFENFRDRRLRREKGLALQREELSVVLARNKHLVILGDPGAGKSTLLRYLMLRLALGKEQFIADFPQLAAVATAIPLYMRLASYADFWRSAPPGKRSLKDFIPEYLHENLLESYVRFIMKQLEEGSVFLLFDGLDEIPDPALRTQIVQQVEAFTRSYSGNRFIVTSRRVGYTDAPLAAGYQPYTLADFNDNQIGTFTQKWCPAYEQWVRGTSSSQQLQEVATKEADQLYQTTQRNPGVRKLAVNPLLLTILALIQRQGVDLPSHRIQLYELCATTLLRTWVRARGKATQFRETDLEKILRPLAFWMHEHQEVGAIPEEELTEQIVKQLRARRVARDEYEAAKLAEQFLHTIRSETGILVERGRQRYGFLHQTFEEYFAARELAANLKKRNEFIKRHLHDSRWREVILLAAGTIGILELKEVEVTELVQEAILHAESPFEEWLHRDLLFAGRCLADDVGVDVTCEDEIIEQIVFLYLTSPYNSLREAFLNVLKAWGSTRTARKAAQLVLSLFSKLEEITNGTLPIVGSSFQEKFTEYYIYLIQTYLEGQIKLVRLQLMLILRQLQIEAADPVELGLTMLSDPDEDVRQAAVTALGQLGANQPEVLAALLKLLSDPSTWQVRQAAATALGQLGANQPEVLAALLKLLSDPDEDVRQAAATALGQLGANQPEVLAALLKLLSDPSTWQVRRAAATALGQLGANQPEVLAALLKPLSDPDEDVRQAAVTTLGQLRANQPEVLAALLKLLSDPDSNSSIRQAAATALGQLGANQPEVLAALLKLLSDPDPDPSTWQVRQAAATALGQLGANQPEVLAALLKLLSDPSTWQVRQAAATALGQLGANQPEVLAALLKLLSDPDEDVRQAAATALGQLGANQPEVLAALLKLLSDPDPDPSTWQVRRAAATALGQLGANQPEVLAALLKLLSDPDPNSSIRQAAVTALGQLGANQPEVLAALLKLLSDPDPNSSIRQAVVTRQVRQAAATALGQLGANQPEVLAALLKLLSDPDPDPSTWQVRQAAATALGQLSSGKPDTVKYLLAVLSDTPVTVLSPDLIDEHKQSLHRNSILRQLKQLALVGANQPEVLAALLKALSDPSTWQVRQAAATALGQLGANQPEVLAALLKALSDPDPGPSTRQVRQAAATALGQLGANQPEVLAALLKLLSDPDPGPSTRQVRQAAATALGQLGANQPEVLAALLKLLSDPDPNSSIRQAAATALGQLRANQPEVLAALLKALSDPDPGPSTRQVRQAAATALGQLGANQPEVLAALLKLLSDPDSNSSIRQAAATALGQLGANQPEVLAALLKLLSDPDPGPSTRQVRQAAATALGQLGANQPEVLAALLKALSDPSTWQVRQAAATALGQLGANQPEVLAALLKALSDPDEDVRQAAATALGQLGANQPEVLAALLKLLSDPDEDVRQAAATALGQLGANQPEVLAALLKLLSDPDEDVRQATSTALATLQIDRPTIGQHIEALLGQHEIIASKQFEVHATVDALLFALWQVIGEV